MASALVKRKLYSMFQTSNYVLTETFAEIALTFGITDKIKREQN